MPAQHTRRRRDAQAPLTRARYDALSDDERKMVDAVRRHLAEALAKANSLPVKLALESIIALHERGHLTMVADGRGVMLVPCLNGKPLAGGFDFSPLGGRS
jgi:hypothetical protein